MKNWNEVQRFMQSMDPNGDWKECPEEEAGYVLETLFTWVENGVISKRIGYIIGIIQERSR